MEGTRPYQNLVENIRNWPVSRKLALAGVALLSIFLFGLIIFQARKVEYRLLYADLPSQEAASVTQWLKEQGVAYQLENNGRSIYVPAHLVYETRLNLAGAGLPRQGGVGFEIFDKQNFGITKFTQKVNFQRAMQGELTRTIAAMDPVRSARVHLVLPEKRLLAEQQRPAKASVVVELEPGRSLDTAQTQSIIHLVAGSIEGLDKNRVTVLDTTGRLLSENGPNSPTLMMFPDKLKFKNLLENRLEHQVQSLLDRALGYGNALVRVTAELDFSQEAVTTEKYDPDGMVPRSEKITKSQSGQLNTGGIPGTESNLGMADAVGAPVPEIRSSELTNYEITKTIKKIQRPVGDVKQISAAVLVADTFDPQANGGKGGWAPIPPEKLESIRKMVVSAIGLDASRGDRIEVVSMPFQKEMLETNGQKTEPSLYEYLPYVKYLLLVICAVLLYLMLVRPVIRTLRGEAVLPPPGGVAELPEESGSRDTKALDAAMRLRKELEDFSVTPAQVVKAWLREG
ncbi:MAG: flagellar M-ring protein FliF [Deltaproteobacteria bacterium]|nr:flagellar M-ring protein FliF [Deltaproteobacteria bacterium]